MPPSESNIASSSQAALDAANDTLADLRLSLDSDQNGTASKPALVNGIINGKANERPRHSEEFSEADGIERVKQELERTREEKEALAAQYHTLLTRLNTMRTTVGNKLKQDAEELDRREQLVHQLTAQNEDLSSTIEALQSEIITSNTEAERSSKQLESMRSRAFEEGAQESQARERELRETQAELEHCRMERDEWERATMEERVGFDQAKSSLESLKRELDMEREARARNTKDLENEREKTSNLQSVLEDFQAAKDHELRQAIRDHESQLTQITQSLAEYKYRAHKAEGQLEESSASTSRTDQLEREVKEKSLLIGKLRHEAVIMNEHLMEALRRLRKNSQDNNVDRRLVTNVLLSFITTPRADSKRFEMLGLLASILSWTDTEREKAGLQRAGPTSSSIWGRTSTSAPSKGKGAELDRSDETESFSQMWVEFLLKESTSGSVSPSSSAQSPSRANMSLPGTPTTGSPGAQRTQRLPSFTAAAMVSSPNLSRPPPPRKSSSHRTPS